MRRSTATLAALVLSLLVTGCDEEVGNSQRGGGPSQTRSQPIEASPSPTQSPPP